jgi:hypothetical protein
MIKRPQQKALVVDVLMVMVDFALSCLFVIRGGRIGICASPSKQGWEPKKVHDSRFRTVCVFRDRRAAELACLQSARLCKKDKVSSAHNPSSNLESKPSKQNKTFGPEGLCPLELHGRPRQESVQNCMPFFASVT